MLGRAPGGLVGAGGGGPLELELELELELAAHGLTGDDVTMYGSDWEPAPYCLFVWSFPDSDVEAWVDSPRMRPTDEILAARIDRGQCSYCEREVEEGLMLEVVLRHP